MKNEYIRPHVKRPDLAERNRRPRPDVAARSRLQHKGQFLYENKEWMRQRYVDDNMTLQEIATLAECALRTVARWMEIHDIPKLNTVIKRESRGTQTHGEDHHRWTGGPPRCITCDKQISIGSTYCMEHRDFSGGKNPKWRGDDIELAGAHCRVKAVRGLASNYRCEHCSKQAQEWAYDHKDPNEKISMKYPNEGTAYSVDPMHYMSLCVSCHRHFDLSIVHICNEYGCEDVAKSMGGFCIKHWNENYPNFE